MSGAGRVLIIDDTEIARESARAILEDAGYAVTALPSPVGAGAVIASERPDLILLDVGMPEMSGTRFLELAARDDFFRDFFEGTPVVLYSERPAAELDAICRRLNAAGALSKALPEGELVARVASFLRDRPGAGAASPGRGTA